MKITHYQSRDKKGRFSHKAKVTMRWAVILTLLYFTGTVAYDLVQPTKQGQPSEVAVENELTIEEQAKLKEQYELAQKEAILKKKLLKLEEDYKNQSAQLEAQLEDVRTKKVSFR